jgi:dihydrodipicolinate synthase/N-acetylneuraminate lyase
MVTTYYKRVQDVGLPLIAFSLTPDLGGALLRGPVVTDLADKGLIVAIKDASFNPLQFLETRDALRASQSDVVLLTGCDNFIYESFLMGAEGIVLGYASIAAPLTREVFEPVRFRQDRRGRTVEPHQDATARPSDVRPAAAELAGTYQGRPRTQGNHRRRDRPRASPPVTDRRL